MYLVHLFLIALLGAAAIRIGAGPERWSVGIVAGVFLLDLVYHMIFGLAQFDGGFDTWHAALDGATLVAMVLVAVKANRMYTLWIAAFQLNAVLAHGANLLLPDVSGLTYFTMYSAPINFQIAVLALGLAWHWRRSRKFGTYRSWARPWPRGDAALPT